MPLPSSTQHVLTTLSIATTALTAGSIFTFPIFGPALTRDLGLSLTQTNLLWGGAVLGEYLTAAIWGALADAKGPRLLSGAAAIMFFVGYQCMAYADVVALDAQRQAIGGPEPKMAKGSFLVTLIAFTAIGSGVAASYFSAVTASTRVFRSRPGLAIAGPLTLFSLSSLFLTSLGTQFFSDEATGDLDASGFLSFLGWLLGATNAFATVFMSTPPTEAPASARPHDRSSSEETPLLHGDDTTASPQALILPGVPESQSIFAFLSTPAVWSLGLLMVVGVGGAEMVLSSIGNVVVALLGSQTEGHAPGMLGILARPGIGPVALEIRASQVKLLAAANTVARLLGGILSDAVAPNPSAATSSSSSSSSSASRSRLPRISRITLLLVAMLLLLGAFTFASFGLDSTDGLPAFSLLVGLSYGLIFVLVPSITVSSFGTANFGRNWGLLSYLCAVGSTAFSLLYAANSDRVAAGDGEHRPGNGATCVAGPSCFRASFQVAMLGMVACVVAIIPVWRRWRNHL
ncbi:MFS general substrate transporter [Jaminaea rosea]|uniref:MFS general substrate transporter n=1 Tax=Jaminaea rosea TaxID=1569628 RepID=A0A316UWP3_9BASI|nr:MFS general substrate transporter [Jaminaea rosea]PWN29727.1 MFS general substrate transporter [Jaminaea rosea]